MSEHPLNAVVACAAALLLLVLGCKRVVCEPGETDSCTCSDTRTGAQSCLSDGSGWDDCECSGDDDDTSGADDDDATGDDDVTGDDDDVDDPPAPVTDFAVERAPTELLLSWVKPADMDLQVVIVRRSEAGFPDSIFSGDEVYAGLDEAFTDTTVVPGTTYYYGAFSVDDAEQAGEAAHASGAPGFSLDITLVVGEVATDPSTGAFDGLEGQTVEVTVEFGTVATQTSYDFDLFCDTLFETRSTTSPVEVEMSGAPAAVLDPIANDLTGATILFWAQSYYSLEPGCDPWYRFDEIAGDPDPEHFELGVWDSVCVEPGIDGDGYPILLPFDCAVGEIVLERFEDGDVTDHAVGHGTVRSDIHS